MGFFKDIGSGRAYVINRVHGHEGCQHVRDEDRPEEHIVLFRSLASDTAITRYKRKFEKVRKRRGTATLKKSATPVKITAATATKSRSTNATVTREVCVDKATNNCKVAPVAVKYDMRLVCTAGVNQVLLPLALPLLREEEPLLLLLLPLLLLLLPLLVLLLLLLVLT